MRSSLPVSLDPIVGSAVGELWRLMVECCSSSALAPRNEEPTPHITGKIKVQSEAAQLYFIRVNVIVILHYLYHYNSIFTGSAYRSSDFQSLTGFVICLIFGFEVPAFEISNILYISPSCDSYNLFAQFHCVPDT